MAALLCVAGLWQEGIAHYCKRMSKDGKGCENGHSWLVLEPSQNQVLRLLESPESGNVRSVVRMQFFENSKLHFNLSPPFQFFACLFSKFVVLITFALQLNSQSLFRGFNA